MTSPLSSNDWEILSAYLDGQLSERDRAQLARRLDAQPELRRALEDLRRTKIVLRSAPRKRAPRNFTISPQMLPQKRRSWFQPVPSMGFASAFATLLLIISLSIEFLPGLNAARLASQAPQAAPVAALTAPENGSRAMDSAAAEATPEPLILWGVPLGMGGGGGGGDGTGVGGMGGGPGQAVIGGGDGQPPAQSAAEPTPEAQLAAPTPTTPPAAASIKPGAEAAQNGGLILGIRPTEELGKMSITEVPTLANSAPTAEAGRQSAPPLNPQDLIGLQVLLGVLALGFAAAAIYFNRRR